MNNAGKVGALVLIFLFVSYLDWQDTEKTIETYCSMVDQNIWPDYKGISKKRMSYGGLKMATPTIGKKARQLAIDWFTASEVLATAKKNELELRNQLVATFFPTGLKKGINKFPMDDGFVIKATGVLNYKVDEAAAPAILKTIKEQFKVDAKSCIRTKLELAQGEYNNLSDEVKTVFNEALTITPGTPQLEIVKPKR
jgi:hypothetical protein